MQVQYLTNLDSLTPANTVLALGFFDGMHTAHRTLLGQTLELSKRKSCQSAMMTFDTHILSYIKRVPFSYLTSLNDKITLAEELGFDIVYVLRVTDDLISMEPQIFIEQFLKSMKHVVVGFDFTFGKRGLGTVADLMKDTNFETTVIGELTYYHRKIGSSRIREALIEGKVSLANHLLGRPYQIIGTVIKGKGRGKHLGFPTANIDYQGYLLPKAGVYLAYVVIGQKIYQGLINVGDNPTFRDEAITLEIYILDFDDSLYGQVLTLQFLQFLRDEWTFASKDDLIEQMKQDEIQARQLFKEMKA